MNYVQTLIAVADDCPVKKGVIPEPRGGKPTVATLQYDMIANSPYVHTQEDVLFQSWLQRQEPTSRRSAAEAARLRKEFFSKPQPCLRSSPLPKKFGWGFLFDQEGRVALCAVDSDEYRKIVAGKAGKVTVLKALRSSRA